MNERQKSYFRAKLVTWKTDILSEARETLEILQQENANHPDLADRASSETDRAIELRARDRQRKLIAKIDVGAAADRGRHLRLLRGDRRADRAEASRRPPDRHPVDRGAGAPRAPRESLSRRLNATQLHRTRRQKAASAAFSLIASASALVVGQFAEQLVISSSSVISTGLAGFFGGPASNVTSSSLSSVSSRLFERASGSGVGGCRMSSICRSAQVTGLREGLPAAILAAWTSAAGMAPAWKPARPGLAPAASFRLARGSLRGTLRLAHGLLLGALRRTQGCGAEPWRGRSGLRRTGPCRRWSVKSIFANEGRAARLAEPDFALDHDVGRTADQKQMLDIVAPHQHQTAMAVDGGRVHDRQPRLAVAAAGDEGAESQAADQPDDHQDDDEHDEGSERPKHCRGKFRTCQAFEPFGIEPPRFPAAHTFVTVTPDAWRPQVAFQQHGNQRRGRRRRIFPTAFSSWTFSSHMRM